MRSPLTYGQNIRHCLTDGKSLPTLGAAGLNHQMLTGIELGAAIESARRAKDVTKKKLAEVFGVKPPSIQGWVTTGRIDKSKLMELMAYFSDVVGPEHWGLSSKVSDYLSGVALAGEDSEVKSKESNVISADFSRGRARDGEIDIPQYDIRAAMGHGQAPADYVETIRQVTLRESYLAAQGAFYTSASNLAIITGFGQSMEGTINDGDPVIIDKGITAFTGDGVYLFTWDDMLYIKRLQKDSPSTFDMISDNPKHKDRIVSMDDVIIHARVLLVWNAQRL